MKKFLKSWWNGLKFDPHDPRYLAGGEIKIAAIGGGTGLSNLLRGLKQYSNSISAIVTVADNGSSTGELRKEFDMVAPGDIRKCIAALSSDERLITELFEFRFPKGQRIFGGHTLGNIWLTALASHFNSFEKSLEVTTEIFQTAGKVLPATLENIDLCIEYQDGSTLLGESHLDEVVRDIKKITLSKKRIRAYTGAIEAINGADFIILGPGSLYGSIIPNLLIGGIKKALSENEKAVKVYVANCSTERTQTCGYTIDDHIRVLFNHAGAKVADHCLVNSHIIKRSSNEMELGEINNITSHKKVIEGCNIVRANVISERNPLFHDSDKLAKALIGLYNGLKR